ncbi:MAG: HNH endonuclease family protein [Bifidobacteriaceae bacterium]|jgi:hypothetical protein|nr:HNH endonuclease family protein [Bifidobacteriaceae bacterium]
MAPDRALPAAPVRFTPEVTAAEAAWALGALAALPVRPRRHGPLPPFDRAAIKARWDTMPTIGIDTKDAVLAGWLDHAEYEANGFTVRSGVLTQDPYTGARVEYLNGQDPERRTIDVDHVVSLRDAWESGARRWSPKGSNWMRFYNWRAGLIPTARATNRAKADHNAADWLPHNTAADYRPRFATLQIQTKTRFHLSVTPAELAALRAALHPRA